MGQDNDPNQDKPVGGQPHDGVDDPLMDKETGELLNYKGSAERPAPEAPAPAQPGPPDPPLKVHRQPSAAARWHMSRKAVDLSLLEVVKWSEDECLEFLIEARWGSRDTVVCPHSNTPGTHYWQDSRRRWKCAGCSSSFSITSGTVFAYRKKPLRDYVTGMLLWANSAPGQPALELKRHLNMTYNTTFVWQHKMREALMRGFNVGFLSGDLEMDGAHQSGWRSAERRGKPQGSQPFTASTPLSVVEAAMLAKTGKPGPDAQQPDAGKKGPKGKGKQGFIPQAGGQRDPDTGRTLHPDRRMLITVRKRGAKGKGASATRVAVGLTEDGVVAKAILKEFAALAESNLNTDTASAYTDVGKDAKKHRTVEHSKQLIGPDGENNNLAEEFNWRYDRTEKGTHLCIEPKYILDYAVETAFRSDTRRIPNGKQLKLAMNVAMGVGESHYWKNFTHGNHREVEILQPHEQPAPASGPAPTTVQRYREGKRKGKNKAAVEAMPMPKVKVKPPR